MTETLWRDVARKYGEDAAQFAALKFLEHPGYSEVSEAARRGLAMTIARRFRADDSRKYAARFIPVGEIRAVQSADQLRRVEALEQLERLDPRLIRHELGQEAVPKATRARLRGWKSRGVRVDPRVS